MEKKKKEKNQKNKKTLCTILKCFTKQETKLLNFMTVIFQWCLRQNIEQLNENDLPEQMLQRLRIALTQVKARNNSESLLNEIRPIAHTITINLKYLH